MRRSARCPAASVQRHGEASGRRARPRGWRRSCRSSSRPSTAAAASRTSGIGERTEAGRSARKASCGRRGDAAPGRPPGRPRRCRSRPATRGRSGSSKTVVGEQPSSRTRRPAAAECRGREPVAMTTARASTRVCSSTISVVGPTKRAQPEQPLRGGNLLDAVEDEADEAVALAPQAPQHRAAVDPDAGRHVRCRTRRPTRRACAASAAATSSFDGMQPTRAQVVPYGPPSISTADLPAAPPRAAPPTRRAGADHGDVTVACAWGRADGRDDRLERPA